MAEIWQLRDAVTRSVSPENVTGAKGAGGMATDGTGARAARELGRGWKVSPSIDLPPGATATLADVAGPGVIRHIWLTTDRSRLRQLVLRTVWDWQPEPAVEVPLGDFFCNGWDELALLDSDMVVVLPAGGLNSYWPMPFRERARITLENTGDAGVPVYYQVTYTAEDLPENAAYLHVTWRRSRPLGSPAVHEILATRGRGHYAGTYLAIEPGAPGWWGEGELKFHLDGDEDSPTICGTGTEDYFGGAWNFDLNGQYAGYSTRFLGLPQILPPDAIYQAHQRFGLYRWHVPDPITFDHDLRVTVQALGWKSRDRYLPLEKADLATTAFWYLDA
ncbi:MAG TPA: glycoside hydrolase family 172 protein [Amycolatopsis sp.]|nr:glycoside hydrolase family 172 protein [Amycolatopsis sp.]